VPATGGDVWVEWNGTQYYTTNLTIQSRNTWSIWNNDYSTTGGTLLSRYYPEQQTYDLTWTTWNQTYSTTTTNYTVYQNNWETWVGVGTNLARPAVGITRIGAPALVRTEEEWTVIREEQERQRAIRDEQQKEARAEARKLMEVVLSKEQMNEYLTKGYFTVIGSEGGEFRIYHGTSGNLKQVVKGQEVNALCVHPQLYDHEGDGYLPTEDSMVAQAFALMHDELGTVQVANVHRGPRHLRAVPDAA